MTPRTPRQHTMLARILAHAQAGTPLPSLEALAFELGFGGYGDAQKLLTSMQAEGLIVVRSSPGRGILSIEAPDGSWRALGGAARRAAAEAPPPRRCLRCRDTFRPAHRHNFLCGPCAAYAESAA